MTALKSWLISLLRRSERYTKTDMVYLASGGFWLGLGNVGVSLFSLVLSIGFATLVTPQVYGVYRYILSSAAIINSFTLTGLTGAVTKSVAQGYIGTLAVARDASLRWSIIPSTIALAGALYYGLNANFTLSFSLIVVAVAAPLTQGFGLYTGYLAGRRDFRRKALLGVSLSAVTTAALLVGMFFLEVDAFLLILIYFAVTAFGTLACYRLSVPRSISKENSDPSAIRYGRHTSLLNILGVFANNLDSVLVFQQLGAAELALYTFATIIPERLKDFVKMIPALATPKLAGKPVPQIKEIVFKRSLLIGALMIPVAAAYILAAPYLYAFLFPQYIASVPYSQALALLLILAGGLSGTAIQVTQALRASYILSFFSHGARIVLTFWLFFSFGIWGLVIARIVSKTATSSLSYYLVSRLK